MAVTIRKGLIGKQDVTFWSSASPTFTRTTSVGGIQTMTAIAATHIPLTNASGYFSAANVERGMKETLSRYFLKQHSGSTYSGQNAAGVGDHVNVFGYRNAAAATSIQAAASNMFLIDGVARVVIPNGTYTAATPIQLPRRCVLIGNGDQSVIRANATNKISRVFTISGTVGATTSNINANATINQSNLTVVNGALFAVDQDVRIRDNFNSELQRIRGIAANVLTFYGKLRHGYRSAATTKDVTVVYPAQIYMDRVKIVAANGTPLGVGIAATVMMDSYFGEGVKIESAVHSGVRLNALCQNNTIVPNIGRSRNFTAGRGYGVQINDAGCHDNVIGGNREGTTGDVSVGGFGNVLWGRTGNSPALASGMSDPMALLYRMRKPELGYASYSVSGTATTVLTCPAGTNNPAEVYIDGRLYRNTGTVLCDLSRTKTPSTATIGGLDRGPATATRAYYVYAVPSMRPSATRQFDLVLSSQSQATGPLASATYPSWSFLGAVSTGGTVRLNRFSQVGNDFYRIDNRQVRNTSSPTAAQATYKVFSAFGDIPVGTKRILLELALEQPGLGPLEGIQNMRISNADNIHSGVYELSVEIGSTRSSTLAQAAQNDGWCSVNSARKFAFRNSYSGSATIREFIYYAGFSVDRAAYK